MPGTRRRLKADGGDIPAVRLRIESDLRIRKQDVVHTEEPAEIEAADHDGWAPFAPDADRQIDSFDDMLRPCCYLAIRRNETAGLSLLNARDLSEDAWRRERDIRDRLRERGSAAGFVLSLEH